MLMESSFVVWNDLLNLLLRDVRDCFLTTSAFFFSCQHQGFIFRKLGILDVNLSICPVGLIVALAVS